MEESERRRLQALAAEIRVQTLWCMARAGGGHVGGAMSIADVLAVLYGGVLCYKPDDPRWEGRDRLVVSKGHSGPALYAALQLSGFFPKEWLETLNRGGTLLPSHCDRNKTPGVDMTTGSLGQGVSAACGMAAALKKKDNPARVYAILGDGELQEGQVWEAVQFAAHRGLDNLCLLVDNNGAQLDGSLEQVCQPFHLGKKFAAFGLYSLAVCGYDVADIHAGIQACRDSGRPSALILQTRKGIGCDFAEAAAFNHFMQFGEEQARQAEAEIRRRLALGLVGRERAV